MLLDLSKFAYKNEKCFEAEFNQTTFLKNKCTFIFTLDQIIYSSNKSCNKPFFHDVTFFFLYCEEFPSIYIDDENSSYFLQVPEFLAFKKRKGKGKEKKNTRSIKCSSP